MKKEIIYESTDDLMLEYLDTLNQRIDRLFANAGSDKEEQPNQTQSAQRNAQPNADQFNEILKFFDDQNQNSYMDWEKQFNNLLSISEHYNETIKQRVDKFYRSIKRIHDQSYNNAQLQFNNYKNQVSHFLYNNILNKLQYNENQNKSILNSFIRCFENLLDSKPPEQNKPITQSQPVQSQNRAQKRTKQRLELTPQILQALPKAKSRTVKESKELSNIHIDFTKSNHLNESFLLMFGTAIKMILKRMFGQDVYLPDMTITGSQQQMQSFTAALASEKRYFDSYVRYGLNDARTYKDKSKLQSAISQFERDTGIKWPFK